MASTDTRKRAIEAFKERKSRRGVFAVRCAATGHTWVGSSRNLDASRNGLWFMLRVGSHRDPVLQAEWQDHGEGAFRYEVLEELDADTPPMLVPDLLKQKKRAWALEEQARTLP